MPGPMNIQIFFDGFFSPGNGRADFLPENLQPRLR